MKLNFVTAILLSLVVQANAEEYEKKGPLVAPVSYEAGAFVDREFEIGKSTFILTADCQANEEAAKKAIAAKLAVVQTSFDAAIAALGLGDRSEKLNYKLDEAVTTELVSPVDNILDPAKEQYVWTNRCTGASSEEPPVRVNKVTKATKTISVWFPNTGKVLNSLTALVTATEALSDKEPAGVKIACSSVNGGNYDLDVSESTRTAALEEIKAVAQKRAERKKDKDFAKAKYQAFWADGEYFQENGDVAIPQISVEKKNGEWVATYTQYKAYTVYYKKSSDPSGDAGQVVDQKDYPVSAQTTGTTGLYGTLSITVSKGCAKDKAEAEGAVAPLGADILAKLREINGGRKTPTESLDVKDPIGRSGNPLVAYSQIKDKEEVQYFYNPCTLEKHEVQVKPKVEAWTGYQTLTIVSQNLNALADLRDSLEKTHVKVNDDPSVLAVSVDWNATATQLAAEDAGAELDEKSWDKFTKADGDGSYKCDASGYSFACLSQRMRGQVAYDSAEFGGAAPKAAAAYSERAVSDVDAKERGAKRISGKYVIKYIVRRVLTDNKR